LEIFKSLKTASPKNTVKINGRIRNQLVPAFESQMFPMKKINRLENSKISSGVFFQAYKAPTIDPASSAIGHGLMSCSSRNLITLACANPRSSSPERTSPIDFVFKSIIIICHKIPFCGIESG
jgi:hypothetical protein